ncbi:MAG: hypothetical protein ACXAE3_05200 [Candidatus Kariarchaeaceae archaeon]|jgi:hypothetical protein
MEGKNKALSFRIDKELEKELERAFIKRDIEFVKTTFHDIEANYKSINVLKKQCKVLDRREKIDWGRQIIETDHPVHQVMGAYLLDQTMYFTVNRDYILETVDRFCRDENWNVRQAGIDLLERMVAKQEGHEISLLQKYIGSDDAYLRRLLLLTAKEIASSANYKSELKAKLLDVLEVALTENDPYVQTICHETFQDGYLKYCTEMTVNWLNDKISTTDDNHIRSTILAILGSRYVEDEIDNVLSIIDTMLLHDEEEIRKARSAALHILSNRYHDKVSTFLEDRMHIQQALDHWAELEADGTLNSFDF